MSSTNAPFGLKPISHLTGGVLRPRTLGNGISNGYTTAIFEGQAVRITGTGVIVPMAATANDIVGSFAGVEYTDTATGRRLFNNRWAASTSASDIVAHFYDDPMIVYAIQADGSAFQSQVGDQTNITAPSSGSTTTGVSSATASTAAVGSGSQGQLRILDLVPYVDNAWGDAYTVLRVQISRHQYVGDKTAF